MPDPVRPVWLGYPPRRNPWLVHLYTALYGALGAAIVLGLMLTVNRASTPTDLREGMVCQYLGMDVQVLAIRPMGTSVIGATLITGTEYARIVPREDLTACH